MTKPLKAVGITCGIGSMLVGARLAGFDVQANIEWRKYYHFNDELGRNTFKENFPRAVMKHTINEFTPQEIERIMAPDLAMGHPECGNFSQLGGTNKNRLENLKDPGDIPLFVDLVARIKPRFFVMDDLPKSFGAFSMEEYVKRLPEYDLFPEWVSNWGYGNIQKWRNRMFMIGSLKSELWAFVPGETEAADRTLENCVGDLAEPGKSNYPNHDPYDVNAIAGRNLGMRFLGDRPTWKEVAEFARANWKSGESMTYHAKDGTIKRKPGYKIEHWDDRGASVQCGQAYKIHPKRLTPLTYRERARIQGFPDDFVFYGTKLNKRNEFEVDSNLWMTKQTGKAMPVQFCRYVAEQIRCHIEGKQFKSSRVRVLRSNEDIDVAKTQYCKIVGYANQKAACGSCWLFSSCTLERRIPKAAAQLKAMKVAKPLAIVPRAKKIFTSPANRIRVNKSRFAEQKTFTDWKMK